MTLVNVTVAGAAYRAALDPDSSSVPGEENWPIPKRRRAGRGFTFTYQLTRDQAAVMIEHLDTLAACFVDDEYSRREGRACAAAARRIRAALERWEAMR